MIGVFIDTFVVLTMTALVVISTLYAGNGPLAARRGSTAFRKTNMAQLAFSSVLGESARQCVRGDLPAVLRVLHHRQLEPLRPHQCQLSLRQEGRTSSYSIIALVFIFLGSCLSNDLVWELTDMFNQLMVLPNVIALMALSGLVAVAARKSGDVHERELHK